MNYLHQRSGSGARREKVITPTVMRNVLCHTVILACIAIASHYGGTVSTAILLTLWAVLSVVTVATSASALLIILGGPMLLGQTRKPEKWDRDQIDDHMASVRDLAHRTSRTYDFRVGPLIADLVVDVFFVLCISTMNMGLAVMIAIIHAIAWYLYDQSIKLLRQLREI